MFILEIETVQVIEINSSFEKKKTCWNHAVSIVSADVLAKQRAWTWLALQTKYLYHKSLWKSFFPMAQWLEHSACNQKVLSLNPNMGQLFFISENISCFKNNSFVDENWCSSLCMVGILCLPLHTMYVSQVTELWLSCYLVLLSIDSNNR